jgi:hypothetical protein
VEGLTDSLHLYPSPETLKGLLAKHGFGTIRRKSYLSKHIKERLERTLVLKPFARMIVRCYSGHSFAVVAKKVENREQASP